FDNCDVLVLKEDGSPVLPGDSERGELCVRGSFLGLGYYNNPEKTAAVFTQNPLNRSYPEIIYHTGDLVSYNERGELIYHGRKDFQIKHMGYRIELGEIEANLNALEGVNECACIYEDSQIILYYQSSAVEEESVIREINARLLSYMRPTRVFRLRVMPHNANGKIDRKKLKSLWAEHKNN
ncbi:MAG: D-alanine--poly(phosphoribitol) ligase, partial [bacterium]